MVYHDPVNAMLTRGRLTSLDDGDGLQRMEAVGLKGATYTKILRPQVHGFTSHPPPGAVGAIIALGGASQRAIFLGGEVPGLRPSGLPLGATAIYDHLGNIVSLVEQRMRIVHSTETVVVCPTIRLGSATANKRVMTEAGPAVKVYAE